MMPQLRVRRWWHRRLLFAVLVAGLLLTWSVSADTHKKNGAASTSNKDAEQLRRERQEAAQKARAQQIAAQQARARQVRQQQLGARRARAQQIAAQQAQARQVRQQQLRAQQERLRAAQSQNRPVSAPTSQPTWAVHPVERAEAQAVDVSSYAAQDAERWNHAASDPLVSALFAKNRAIAQSRPDVLDVGGVLLAHPMALPICKEGPKLFIADEDPTEPTCYYHDVQMPKNALTDFVQAVDQMKNPQTLPIADERVQAKLATARRPQWIGGGATIRVFQGHVAGLNLRASALHHAAIVSGLTKKFQTQPIPIHDVVCRNEYGIVTDAYKVLRWTTPALVVTYIPIAETMGSCLAKTGEIQMEAVAYAQLLAAAEQKRAVEGPQL